MRDEVCQGDRILDVGCGTGALLRKLAEAVGVWSSTAAIAVNAVKDMCVVCLPSLPDDWHGHFDTICCTEILEHLDDPAAAIAVMAKCLRPAGRLVIPAPDGCMHPTEIDEHIQSFDRNSLESLLLRFFSQAHVKSVSGTSAARYLIGCGIASELQNQ